MSKNSVHYGHKNPGGEMLKGDLWYKPTNDNEGKTIIKLMIFDGNEWKSKKE